MSDKNNDITLQNFICNKCQDDTKNTDLCDECEQDTTNAQHPLRQKAIAIIENVIEPFINKGIRGKEYFELEDALVKELNKKINKKYRKNKLQKLQ